MKKIVLLGNVPDYQEDVQNALQGIYEVVIVQEGKVTEGDLVVICYRPTPNNPLGDFRELANRVNENLIPYTVALIIPGLTSDRIYRQIFRIAFQVISRFHGFHDCAFAPQTAETSFETEIHQIVRKALEKIASKS